MVVQEGKTQLIGHVLELEEKVYQALRPIVPKEWLSVDLTMPQLNILLVLFTDGPTRMSVLASSLGVSLATATGIVDRLVERGIILREGQPGDRRVVLCKLSDKGQELVGRLWGLGRAQVRSLLETVTIPKLRLIAEAMDTILQAAQIVRQDCGSELTSAPELSR
jgi:DNA-binding MarR family transcriptional regulator